MTSFGGEQWNCVPSSGTKHVFITEIFEFDEGLESAASDAELQKGVMDGGAYLLVSESIGNIPTPLTQLRELGRQLREVII